MPNRFVRLSFFKVHLASTSKHSEIVTTCRDSAILSESGFPSQKSRQLVADTSELVQNLSETCLLACARGQDSIMDFGIYKPFVCIDACHSREAGYTWHHTGILCSTESHVLSYHIDISSLPFHDTVSHTTPQTNIASSTSKYSDNITLLFKPKLNYANFATKSATCGGLSCGHKSWKSATQITNFHDLRHKLSWFVSGFLANFPHALSQIKFHCSDTNEFVTVLSQTLPQTSWHVKIVCVCDLHRNFMISWFVTVCIGNFHDLCPRLSLQRNFSESWRNGIWALSAMLQATLKYPKVPHALCSLLCSNLRNTSPLSYGSNSIRINK